MSYGFALASISTDVYNSSTTFPKRYLRETINFGRERIVNHVNALETHWGKILVQQMFHFYPLFWIWINFWNFRHLYSFSLRISSIFDLFLYFCLNVFKSKKTRILSRTIVELIMNLEHVQIFNFMGRALDRLEGAICMHFGADGPNWEYVCRTRASSSSCCCLIAICMLLKL